VRVYVTRGAHRNEVLFGIVSEPPARLNIMHLEFAHGAATLATPPVSLEYLHPAICGKRRDRAVAVDVLSRETSRGPSYLIQEFAPFEFR
jgi:hypothetical protein